ncbi:O-antigen ligase domain-containing protein [Oscillatoria sp. FACHB-1407]|uniref:O-antigen ligase domain-containing protein n=1 Tax=Oscillatoria sp. FACHB-1407 TaxID=2692847 RepID=UPI0016879E03|nr:O-antigen ligase domain-containing protein [Oscillatoria sp. FACHB-1407]MBD2459705.1 O-antigen ligase domain-containing protein [Oscillatoria sp. FACHB-1407]
MTSPVIDPSNIRSSHRKGSIAILGLAIFLTVFLSAGAGRILIPLFPLSTLVVGFFLYFQAPVLYVSFTWWMWFLAPVIRRMIDYQSGYLTPGPWTLVSTLVTFISVITLIKYLPRIKKQEAFPFILCSGAVFYGFFIGLINNEASSSVLTFLGWINPILLGFHLYIHWERYPIYSRHLQKTFLWGVLVMGVYGLYQYFVAPEWDRFWLRSIEASSFGDPEPLGIRVCSTMDAPQPFAAVMMAGLILLFSNNENLRFASMATGYLAFLLSLARSAWLNWAASFLILFPSLKSALQLRLVITILLALILILPVASIEPFSTVINSRLESFTNTSTDTSYQDRSRGYMELMGDALTELTGKGLGMSINSNSIGSRDSGILSILFSLGWFGTIPYIAGIILLFLKLFQGSESRFDSVASTSRAIALGTFLQIGFNIIFEGSIGIVLWGFLGVGLAAHRYYLHQSQLISN